MINYDIILKRNLINVLRDILQHVKDNGLSHENQIYITFSTTNKKNIIPKWLLNKYPKEMTIILQYEYYDLIVNNDFFNVTLSFNNLKTNLNVNFDSIISFADPVKNFGLKVHVEKDLENKNIKNNKYKNNVVDFNSYKKD